MFHEILFIIAKSRFLKMKYVLFTAIICISFLLSRSEAVYEQQETLVRKQLILFLIRVHPSWAAHGFLVWTYIEYIKLCIDTMARCVYMCRCNVGRCRASK